MILLPPQEMLDLVERTPSVELQIVSLLRVELISQNLPGC